MAASSLSLSQTLPATMPGVIWRGPRHGPALPARRKSAARCAAFRRSTSGGRGQYGGAPVDEDMSVLRRRIRKAQMAETNYKPPPEWAAWEKQCYSDAASSATLQACSWPSGAPGSASPTPSLQ